MEHVNTIGSFLRLTRPLFLFGGANLYAIGVFIALADGYRIDILHLLAGQAMVTAIQLMTHYANEYYDQASDRLNTERTWFSGGSGVLVDGEISPKAALNASIACALAGFVVILYGFTWSLPFAVLGLVSMALAWSYSGPPLRLVARGVGELVASIVVAGLVPMVGYISLSGGALSDDVLATALPLMMIHFAMLIAFAVPDVHADAAVGKWTAVVRLGAARTVIVHNLLLLAAFCVILLWIARERPGVQWLWLAVPLAVWQCVAIINALRERYAHDRSSHYRQLTMGAVGLFAFTAFLWLAGYAAPLLAQVLAHSGG